MLAVMTLCLELICQIVRKVALLVDFFIFSEVKKKRRVAGVSSGNRKLRHYMAVLASEVRVQRQ